MDSTLDGHGDRDSHPLPPQSWLQYPSAMEAHLRSKTRTEPSADTEAKTPTPPQAMSYTALSWAISCVSTTPFCRHR